MPADAEVTTRSGLVSFAPALVGLAISLYLTVEHYSASTTLICPESGGLNCAKVTSSSWASVGPVPVALLGTVFFAAMAVLTSPMAWRLRSLDAARVVGSVVGVSSALYLVWVELFRVNAICTWCTGVHVATVVLLACVLWTITEIRE